jgi:flagellar hook-associated protein 2
MATISSLGVGSGLDLEGMVTKLMAVESQPLTTFDTKEASFQSKISALGSLKGALASLQTAMAAFIPTTGQTAANKFTTFSASVADSSVASATASTGAVAGTYNLQVTSVAQSQQLKSTSTAYASESTVVGTGTIILERGSVAGGVGSGGAFTSKSGTAPITITIDATNNTLGGIRDAINKANAHVSATIVNSSGSSYLMLTSTDTGTQDVMKISGTLGAFNYDPSPPPAPLTDTMSETQAATDAALKINSIPITSTSNTITNAITGVTVTLKSGATLPANTTVTVSKDNSSSLVAAFTAMVKAYNDFSSTAHSLSSYDAVHKKAAILLGNATLRAAQTQVNQVLGAVPAGATGAYQRLAQLGVTIQRDGTMALDTAKLNAAISNDYNSVAALAAGLGKSMNTALTGLVGTGGIVDSATKGMNASIKDIDDQRTKFQSRLADIEKRYRAQFSALDTSVAQMKTTSTYLTQQLAALLPTKSNQ